jgi:2-polyprenyl-6-methoxyphenol hydroxylase-like FAD-dependent oxidoreductase
VTLPSRCDVAIVGGGVAGATLAYVLARGGLDVTVLERQPQLRDRVMGEALAPWGVAEAIELDVFELMRPHGVVLDRVFAFDSSLDSDATSTGESLRGKVPGVPGVFGVGNPALASAMSQHAATAGATIVAGATVREVAPPRIRVEVDGATHAIEARMIVGADGKASATRRQLGIDLLTSGPYAQCSGLLAAELGDDVPPDAVTTGVDQQRLSVVFPQGAGRARLYHMFPTGRPNPFLGDERAARFLARFAESPIPWGQAVADARPAGPCATFPIHDSWTVAPDVPGAVLVGDAAGYSNPLCAQGLSVCVRDVHLVSDALLGSDRWGNGIFHGYREERAQRMSALRTFAQFFHLANIPAPDAAHLRGRIRRLVESDPQSGAVLETINLGPGLAPPFALDPQWIESTFGVRLGADPTVVV